MITVIDTGICNIGSVLTALDRIGAKHTVATDKTAISAATSLLLPGVGAFADGMEALRRYDLINPIRHFAQSGKPLLGICLGMQLLADRSEEFGDHEGLKLIPGQVRRLPDNAGPRIPNIGWCDTECSPRSILFKGIANIAAFYYDHSYVMTCDHEQDSTGEIGFGSHRVTTAVERGNVFGAQFHPEKSQDVGLMMLNNFCDQVRKYVPVP